MIIVVVLLAGILVIAARRERDEPLAQGEGLEAPLVVPQGGANRRTVRPNEIEDPILAAMGIGETEGGRP